MTIRQKDKNRAELVQAIIRQNGGRIFTVVAKRKKPKHTGYIVRKKCDMAELAKLPAREGDHITLEEYKENWFDCPHCELEKTYDHFMTMTCRTGVKSQLKGGTSTIKDKPELISVNLTNGEGYRCFSAYNVLELRAGGTTITFKKEDVLAFEE